MINGVIMLRLMVRLIVKFLFIQQNLLIRLIGWRNWSNRNGVAEVLIHAAAGGVGLVAIQYAKSVGAEVLATAGAEELRWATRWGSS